MKNATTKFGQQIFPEFVITQGAKSLSALEEIKNFFECGGIFVNKRYDNHNENLYRYCVRSLQDLEKRIIPFFQEHQLHTCKQNDFLIFEKVIDMMVKKEHLTEKGRDKIIDLIGKMNRKKQRI